MTTITWPVEPSGIWITFHSAPYEGCSQIVPHANEHAALTYMASQGSYMPSVRFVPFGEELKP